MFVPTWSVALPTLTLAPTPPIVTPTLIPPPHPTQEIHPPLGWDDPEDEIHLVTLS